MMLCKKLQVLPAKTASRIWKQGGRDGDRWLALGCEQLTVYHVNLKYLYIDKKHQIPNHYMCHTLVEHFCVK